MNAGNVQDPIYILGHSEEERQRLIAQAALYGPLTEQMLIRAGISSGMRVLDVGCGVGDVSLLAARLVGPIGHVVGIDREVVAVNSARERAQALGVANVRFQAGDPRDVSFEGPFDAAIGRFVLMYQADPTATLRGLSEKVRSGGILAFQELEFTDPPGLPQIPAWQRSFTWWRETAIRAGIEVHMGNKLHAALLAAGLEKPQLQIYTPVGAGPDFAGYRFVAESVRSIIPLMEKFGVATAEEVDIQTLAHRLRADTLATGGVLVLPHTMGAWATKS